MVERKVWSNCDSIRFGGFYKSLRAELNNKIWKVAKLLLESDSIDDKHELVATIIEKGSKMHQPTVEYRYVV